MSYDAQRLVRQCTIIDKRIMPVPGKRINFSLRDIRCMLTAEDKVDTVAADTEAADNDEQYTDDSRLASFVRVDNGRSLVRMSDVHRLNASYDIVLLLLLLLLLHLDDLFLSIHNYTQA